MNKKISVSVIVPIYNVEKYLRKCLDTIINQTQKNIEIICINDGSTDDSYKILEEYAKLDKRIVIINQENLGLSVARNVGISKSHGEFIGFIDSDDWIDLNYFEALYNVAKKHNADIACCGFLRAYSASKFKKRMNIVSEAVFELANEKFRATDTPRRSYVFNKIYKREVIEKHKLQFPPGVYFEDTHFMVRALYFSKKLVTTPDTLYYYRVNRSSITRGSQTDKKQRDLILAREDFINFARKKNIRCDDDKYFIQKKIFHKFCGILFLKICVWETIKKYYLFGLIKIWETRYSL